MNIPTINLARTGTNIVMLRKAAGLTVHDLQMAFGFNSPQAIYKWQNGTALPTVDNLIALAALLHVRIDDILITVLAPGTHSHFESGKFSQFWPEPGTNPAQWVRLKTPFRVHPKQPN